MDLLISIIPILFSLYIFTVIIIIITENKEPSVTFAWFIIFMLFPIFGIIIYYLFGRNWRRQTRKKKVINQFLEKQISKHLNKIEKNSSKVLPKNYQDYHYKFFNLLNKNSYSILTDNNNILMFHSGKEIFSNLLNDLRSAKKFIHMEYFIWKDDELTKEVQKILRTKAVEGVEIRILYDSWGSFFLSKSYKNSLKEVGIKIYPFFNFMSLWKMHTLNYRNHRKIVVIDGKIGYTGGANMGKEYTDGGKRFPSWRDAHIRIEGDAVIVLESIFTIDWYNTTKKRLFENKYFPIQPKQKNKIPLQLTSSGPDSTWQSIQQLYFSLITSAQKKVYIKSPYFIPDQSIRTALKTAALSGLDVRIMITGLPDKKVPFWAAHSFFPELIEAGVKIFLYKKGFLHAKTITIDGMITSIGTANLDIRSFQLAYEVNSLIYNQKITIETEKYFLNDQKDSLELTKKKFKEIKWYMKFRNSLARLFAPLL